MKERRGEEGEGDGGATVDLEDGSFEFVFWEDVMTFESHFDEDIELEHRRVVPKQERVDIGQPKAGGRERGRRGGASSPTLPSSRPS